MQDCCDERIELPNQQAEGVVIVDERLAQLGMDLWASGGYPAHRISLTYLQGRVELLIPGRCRREWLDDRVFQRMHPCRDGVISVEYRCQLVDDIGWLGS